MKHILITGAAQGIGLATARRYAEQGWFVGLYDLNEEKVEELLASGEFPNACGGHCDVAQIDSIRAMVRDFSVRSAGTLDLLVNNAGVLSAGAFADINQHQHDMMIEVNVAGATHVLHTAFPLLRATPGATVVNLCSASSIHGVPGLAVYSASKFYIKGLTEALDLEWREHGIRVTCVMPPLINTSMGQAVDAAIPQKHGLKFEAEDVAQFIQRAAEGRGTAFVLGGSARTWSILDKFLPDPLRHKLTQLLLSQ